MSVQRRLDMWNIGCNIRPGLLQLRHSEDSLPHMAMTFHEKMAVNMSALSGHMALSLSEKISILWSACVHTVLHA